MGKLNEPAVLFERAVTTDNPILKVAFELANPLRTPAEFDASVANAAAYEALSDAEKQKRRIEGHKAVMQFIESLKNDSPEEDQKQADKMQHRIALLRAALN
ncbi:hypothetical protein [Burkholderia ubonensis]|uniref:hypothetical protein n=1 Tax=Burkholderia ubonensis TaxID=101571 RepID=UPI00075BD177|nr:hypothetical protein [Burkholderia ubonensis]KVZ92728.1 hypothetical protein WL25_17190 [Burkholderia ubonensis]